jgi:GTP-binding protein
MSLDDCIEYLSADELLEVTPQNLRLRKRILNTDDRRKASRREDKDAEE